MKPDTPRGEALRERIRADLRRELPDCQVSFEAADIVSQVMSFGSPTPIEVAVQGASLANDYEYAQKIQSQLAKLSFVRDLQFAQEYNYPTLDITINRERAGQFGLDDGGRGAFGCSRHVLFPVHRAELLARSEFRQCVPDSGGAAAESHAERGERRAAFRSCWTATGTRELTNIAQMKLGTMPGLIERFNGQHIVSLTANIHGITLGEAAQKLNQALAGAGAPPRGVKVVMKGEIPPLEQTISGLRIGLLLAVVVIFLLLSANFQSMRLALAIVLTVPAVLCGVLLMLLATNTTLNIQSFMGAIMAIGIAVANSILLVTFAERFRHENRSVMDAAREGASSRLRAILMTAAAMIFGMLPMAIGFGEGGSQVGAAGPRRHRRSAGVHLCDVDHPSLDLRHPAAEGVADVSVAQSDGSREPIL